MLLVHCSFIISYALNKVKEFNLIITIYVNDSLLRYNDNYIRPYRDFSFNVIDCVAILFNLLIIPFLLF